MPDRESPDLALVDRRLWLVGGATKAIAIDAAPGDRVTGAPRTTRKTRTET
jgi:hypothetical protein